MEVSNNLVVSYRPPTPSTWHRTVLQPTLLWAPGKILAKNYNNDGIVTLPKSCLYRNGPIYNILTLYQNHTVLYLTFFYTSNRRNITFVWDSSYEHCRPFFLSLLLYSHFLLGCSCQGCGDYPGGKSDGLIRLLHSHPIPDCSTLLLYQISPLSSYTRLLHSPPVPDCSTLILYHIAPLSS